MCEHSANKLALSGRALSSSVIAGLSMRAWILIVQRLPHEGTLEEVNATDASALPFEGNGPICHATIEQCCNARSHCICGGDLLRHFWQHILRALVISAGP